MIAAPVCYLHGQNANVKARAAARIAEWEAAQRELGTVERDPAEALLAAAREADQLTQRLRAALDSAGPLNAATVASLGEWLDRTAKISKLVLDAQLDERRMRITERLAGQIEQVLRASAAAVFALLRERLDGSAATVLDTVERSELPVILRRELLAAVPEDGGKADVS